MHVISSYDILGRVFTMAYAAHFALFFGALLELLAVLPHFWVCRNKRLLPRGRPCHGWCQRASRGSWSRSPTLAAS